MSISTKSRRRIKRSLTKRDGLICMECGDWMDPKINPNHPMGMTIDHVTLRALGGSNRLENLRLLHKHCNGDLGAIVHREVEAIRLYDSYVKQWDNMGDF